MRILFSISKLTEGERESEKWIIYILIYWRDVGDGEGEEVYAKIVN